MKSIINVTIYFLIYITEFKMIMFNQRIHHLMSAVLF